MIRYSDYDCFAGIYNKHWGDRFTQQVFPILKELILRQLPEKARILDLCCGTGQLAQLLIEHGFQVTGLDGSEEMVRYARENAPAGEFIVDDARSFNLPDVYHAVISTYDSLNHLMTLGELNAAFHNVYTALQEGGLFVFDLNMEEGYKARWRGSFSIVEDDHVCVFRSAYRQVEQIGQSEITIFCLDGNWERSDFTLVQKCYSEKEIREALKITGFTKISAYHAERDFKMPRGVGRVFFVCGKK